MNLSKDKHMTTDFYAEDLEILVGKYKKGKERFVNAVNEDSFVESARYLPDSIKWKKHCQFARDFNIYNLDKITDQLEDKVVESRSVANGTITESVVNVAIQDAEKEQYAFCLRLQKIIARRNAR